MRKMLAYTNQTRYAPIVARVLVDEAQLDVHRIRWRGVHLGRDRAVRDLERRRAGAPTITTAARAGTAAAIIVIVIIVVVVVVAAAGVVRMTLVLLLLVHAVVIVVLRRRRFEDKRLARSCDATGGGRRVRHRRHGRRLCLEDTNCYVWRTAGRSDARTRCCSCVGLACLLYGQAGESANGSERKRARSCSLACGFAAA